MSANQPGREPDLPSGTFFHPFPIPVASRPTAVRQLPPAPSYVRADSSASSSSAYKPFGGPSKPVRDRAQAPPVQPVSGRGDRPAFSLPQPPQPTLRPPPALPREVKRVRTTSGPVRAGSAPPVEDAAKAQHADLNGNTGGNPLGWAAPRTSKLSIVSTLPATDTDVPVQPTTRLPQPNPHAGPARTGPSVSQPVPMASDPAPSAPIVYKLPTPYKGRNYTEKHAKVPASSSGSFAPFSAIIRGVPFGPSGSATETSVAGDRPRKRARAASPAFELVVPRSVPPTGTVAKGGAARTTPSTDLSSDGISKATAPAKSNLSRANASQFNVFFSSIMAAAAQASRPIADGSRSSDRTISSNRSIYEPPGASSAPACNDDSPASSAAAVAPSSSQVPTMQTPGVGRSDGPAVGSSGTTLDTSNTTAKTSKPVLKKKDAVPIKQRKSFELDVPIYVRPKSADDPGAAHMIPTSSADAKSATVVQPHALLDGQGSVPAQTSTKSKGKKRTDDRDGHASDGSSSSSLTPIESSSSSSSLTPINSSEDEGRDSVARIPQKRVGPPKWTRLPARPPKQPRASQGRVLYVEPTDEEFLLTAPPSHDDPPRHSAPTTEAMDDQDSDEAVSRGLITGDWTLRSPDTESGSTASKGKQPQSSRNGRNGAKQSPAKRVPPRKTSSGGRPAEPEPSAGTSTLLATFALPDLAAAPPSTGSKGRRQLPSHGTNNDAQSAGQAAFPPIVPNAPADAEGDAALLPTKVIDVYGNVIVSKNGLAGDIVDEVLSGKYGFHLQTKSCAAWVSTLQIPSNAPPVSRCHECIAKRSGFVCCFQGIRYFPLDADGRVLPYPVFRDIGADDEQATLPTAFNEPFTTEQSAFLRSAITKYSQTSLKAELDHAERPESVRLPRHLGTTYTCDGCATSILFASWMCTTCAREFCRDCRSESKTLSMEEIRQHAASRRLFTSATNGEIGGTNVFKVDKLTRCVSNDRHGPEQWIPIIRVDRRLLRRTVADMTWWKDNHPLSVPDRLPQEWLDYHLERPDAREVSLNYLKVPGRYLPPTLDEGPGLARGVARARAAELPAADAGTETALPSGLPRVDKAALPTQLHSFAAGVVSSTQTDSGRDTRSIDAPPRLPKTLSQLGLFSALWQRGCPFVVDLAPEDYPLLPWDPEFFVGRFRAEACRIGSARVKQTLRDGTAVACERAATVGDFFATFGKVRDHTDIEKIKDWPSAQDFKVEYPDLWEDFMSILPAGCVTRRDGALDFAAHMPAAANPPDLGPKGYFSQISDATPGGAGSTKLHMDVADAVNIMLWSSDAPDGSPGVAAWDLFRAQDAELISEFLYEQIAASEGLKDAAEARKYHDDPIHAQRFYLDAGLLDALHRSTGIKPYRILQRPGQAVFIPAAVAHQVCNLADCIKVATDFVSVENLDGCSRVTSQFRKQTKDKMLWRTDVLQLKSMLLWAWQSTERFRPFAEGQGQTL